MKRVQMSLVHCDQLTLQYHIIIIIILKMGASSEVILHISYSPSTFNKMIFYYLMKIKNKGNKSLTF